MKKITIPDKFHQEIIELYLKGDPIQKLAAQFDVGRRHITKLLLQNNITIRNIQNNKIEFSDEDVINLRHQGWSLANLSEKFKVGHNKIEKILIKSGLPTCREYYITLENQNKIKELYLSGIQIKNIVIYLNLTKKVIGKID